MKNNKKAFTLIELLVVIAIIALLLGILMPTLTKVKENAMYVICKTGLHQYGLAGAMYLHENDDLFPHPYRWLHNPRAMVAMGYPRECAWHDARNDYEQNPKNAGTLWPYLASKDIHVCPKFGKVAPLYGLEHSNHNDSGVPIDSQYSYCVNGFLGDGADPTSPYSVMKKSTGVRSPVTTAYFCEENTWEIENFSDVSLNNNHFIGRTDPYGPANFSAVFATFHGAKLGKQDSEMGQGRNSGYSNAVFLDGRVDKVFPEETFKMTWPK